MVACCGFAPGRAASFGQVRAHVSVKLFLAFRRLTTMAAPAETAQAFEGVGSGAAPHPLAAMGQWLPAGPPPRGYPTGFVHTWVDQFWSDWGRAHGGRPCGIIP